MSRLLTVDDVLAVDGMSVGEVLDVLGLDKLALLEAAAEALRGNSAGRNEEQRRRLLAWRLDRLNHPEGKRRGRPPKFDVEMSKRFLKLQEAGATYGEAVEELSPYSDPFDRTVQRRVAATKKEAHRQLAETIELLEEVCRAIHGE